MDNIGIAQVGEWLASIELPQYIDSFQSLGIDGMLLAAITEDDLKEDLGIKVRLHRLKILRNIPGLFSLRPQPSSTAHFTSDTLLLRAKEGELDGQTFLIGRSGLTIGRDSSNDIVLSDSTVSRRHCALEFASESFEFLLKDYGSTTGTFALAEQNVALKKNTLFKLGQSEFQVTNVQYSPYGVANTLSLEVFEGPAQGQQATVPREGISIGTHESNELSIPDDFLLDGFHSAIRLKDKEFALVQKEGTGWVRLSGEGVEGGRVSLVVGTVMQVGSSVFEIGLPEKPSAAKEIKQVTEDKEETFPPSEPCEECKICMEQEADSALYPCGHVYCAICTKSFRNCPVCNAHIEDVIRIYK